jgi:LmbE family N-acetylglucosaminyl deacetylase
MIDESKFLTFKTENTEIFNNKSVLILIPHQDDESFGCGGTLSLIKNNVKKLDFCLVTDGSKSDKNITSEMRNKEFENVANLLNVNNLFYLNFIDRDVSYKIKELKDKLSNFVFNYDYIFSTSIFDIHPDHRATAKTLLNLYMESGKMIPTFLCEININQLFINFIVDITQVMQDKINLIKQYKSQLSLINYLDHIIAINKTRVLSVQTAKYAEAFYLLKNLDETKKLLEYSEVLKI